MALAREHVAALAALQAAAACDEGDGNLPRLALAALARLVPGDEHVAWLPGCPGLAIDAHGERVLDEDAWTDGAAGVATVPVALGSDRLGALAVVRRDDTPCSPDELDLLGLAAGTLALTLVAIGSREERRRALERDLELVDTLTGSALAPGAERALAHVADGARRIAGSPLVTLLLAEAGATRIVSTAGPHTTLLLDLGERPLAPLLDIFEPGPLAGARPFLHLSLPGLLGALAPRRAGLPARARELGLHGALVCPIAVPSGVVGVLVVALAEGPLDPSLVAPLAALAGHAGALLARADEGSSLAGRRGAGLALAAALAERDPAAGTAARIVSGLARDVARELGLDEPACEEAWLAGLLHGIGRLALPGRAFGERPFARETPAIAERILRAVPGLEDVATAVRATHERIDGDGYPDGLVADAIPLVARIVAVCEAWHVLPASPDARERLEAAAGSALDADAVEALCSVLDEHAWRVLRRAS